MRSLIILLGVAAFWFIIYLIIRHSKKNEPDLWRDNPPSESYYPPIRLGEGFDEYEKRINEELGIDELRKGEE